MNAPTLPPTRSIDTVSVASMAMQEPPLPSRKFYKWLASHLILDERAFEKFMRRCHVIARAGFYGLKSAEAVAGVVLKGYSLGMDFMESLDKIKFIHGTPVLRGPAAVSHIHSVCEGAKLRCVTPEGEELERSVWSMERPGWEAREFTYTWEQAVKAKLPDHNDTWNRYPERCLKWQAASVGVQEMFGDILAGMYLAEELEQAPISGRVVDTSSSATSSAPSSATARTPAISSGNAGAPASEDDLDFMRQSLHFWGMKWAWLTSHVLDRVVTEAPTDAEARAILEFFERLGAQAEAAVAGSKIPGTNLSVKTYHTEFDRHRGCVENRGPDGMAIEWAGGARHDAGEAAQEAALAAVLISLELTPPDPSPDEEPDPEIVKAHKERAASAIEDAKRGIAPIPGPDGSGARPSEVDTQEISQEISQGEDSHGIPSDADAG